MRPNTIFLEYVDAYDSAPFYLNSAAGLHQKALWRVGIITLPLDPWCVGKQYYKALAARHITSATVGNDKPIVLGKARAKAAGLLATLCGIMRDDLASHSGWSIFVELASGRIVPVKEGRSPIWNALPLTHAIPQVERSAK